MVGMVALVASLSCASRFSPKPSLNAAKCNARNHDVLVYSFQRQRSISLSSLDSENEIELDGKSCTGPVGVNNRACRSQTSTHSLNEADLLQVIVEILREVTSSFGTHARGEYYSKFSFDRTNIRR